MPFVTFEGIDGSGKSTQAQLLAEWLRERGRTVVLTKEPWGGRLGKRVRSLLVDPDLSRMLSATEELLLICAARYDHVRSVIEPALAAGQWVISDRFVDTTYAYQIFDVLDEDLLHNISKAVSPATIPDVTFVLDLDPAVAKKRLESRTDNLSVDPAEQRRDFERIRRGFLAVAKRGAHRYAVIDATLGVPEVASTVIDTMVESGLPC